MQVPPNEICNFLNMVIGTELIRQRFHIQHIPESADTHVIRETVSQLNAVMTSLADSIEAKDTPPPYETSLQCADFISLKSQVDLILSKTELGLAGYTMLHPKFKSYYRQHFGRYLVTELDLNQTYFLGLFNKLGQVCSLLAMEKRGLIRQLIDGPSSPDEVDIDLISFYKRERDQVNGKYRFVARFIWDADIIMLRRIEQITVDEINRLWLLHPSSDYKAIEK